MSSRKLIKHILIYGSGVWAGKAIGFIMIPVYTRALRPSDYGALELASRSIDIAAMVLGLGMVAAVMRFHADVSSELEREEVIRTAVVFVAIVGLTASAVLAWMATPLSAVIFGTQRYAFAFRLALIAMGLELATAVPLALLRVHERSVLFAGVNLGRLLIGLGLNIYLVVLRRMGVVGVFTSNLIGVSVVLLVLIVATRRYWRLSINHQVLRRMLAYSLPLVPSSLAMFVLNFGDRYFLRSYWGLDVLGVYALGYKLCLVMPALVMEPLGLAWSAVVFEVANREDCDRVYVRYFNGYMFCVAFFSVALAALSRDVIAVMADAGYRGASAVVPVVLLGFVAWASVNVFEIGALLSKRTWLRTVSSMVAAVAAMVAYAVLIPLFGAMGAAWATVIGFTAMSVTSYVTSAKARPIPYDMKRAGKLMALGVLVYGVSALVPGVGLKSALGRVLAVATFPVLLYLAGYFEPENVAAVLGKWRAESGERRAEDGDEVTVVSDLSEKGTRC